MYVELLMPATQERDINRTPGFWPVMDQIGLLSHVHELPRDGQFPVTAVQNRWFSVVDLQRWKFFWGGWLR